MPHVREQGVPRRQGVERLPVWCVLGVPRLRQTLDAGIALVRHLHECDRRAESESESESRSDVGGSSSDECE